MNLWYWRQSTLYLVKVCLEKKSFALVREGSLLGIITDRDYLKHPLIHWMEFGKLHAGTDENYFDLLEDILLAWDIVAYELVSNKRWSH